MVGRIAPSLDNGRLLIRAVNRPMAFVDSTDIDISEWLGDHPAVTRIIDAPLGSTEEIISTRLNNHVGRSISFSSPSEQQIRFETPAQQLGLHGTLVSAVLLQFILHRSFQPALPCPKHFEPGRFRECDTADSLHIAALSHNLIAGRIDGRTLTGPNFVYRLGLTFGVRVDNAQGFPNDETIVTLEGRPHLTAEQWVSVYRRFAKPLDSLSSYLERSMVVFHGLGFHKECRYREAVLMITDVSLLATRPERPILGLTAETPEDLRFETESTVSSLPAWLEAGQDEEEN